MKNIFKLLTILLITAAFLSSCTKNFDEINTNPKALTVASLDKASYGFVVKRAITGGVYLEPYGASMQIIHSLFFDTYANYFATTAPNFLSDRYVMVGSWLSGDFDGFYGNLAPQIKYAEDFARSTSGLEPEFAMMKVWKVYIFDRYTDALGPIVYSKFGNMQRDVPYDAQSAIYASFFAELDSSVTILKANAGKTSATLANYDDLYQGNLDRWQKFASSLRLRLALRIKYVLPDVAKTQAEKALSEGVITDNADNGWVTTTKDQQNPYDIISDWGEYRMSADMESILKGYLDPRVASYFAPAKEPDATDDPAGIEFPYEGMRNGQSKNDRSAVDFNSKMSDMSDPYTVVGGAGPKWQIIRAFETYFLRAEGALENWNMGGTAADLYKTGIETSLAENGLSDANLAGDPYTSSTLVPMSPGIDLNTLPANDPPFVQEPVSTVPIAFLTGGTKEQQLEQIITQKWIGLYPDSQEAYAERRRTHYPILYNRLESENLDVPATSLPVRLVYWASEYTNNVKELTIGIEKLNSESTTPNGDKASTKLWWDKKP
jgi:hypothetical protein